VKLKRRRKLVAYLNILDQPVRFNPFVFREVLRKIALVEPTFGKPYLKVELEAIKLERLKREYLGRYIY
tara:strand:- start:3671 stop:3877 length:207 start_codon:yes stop_codon:yes gene_type:complete